MYTYQEDIIILDRQTTFDGVIGNAHDMYDLLAGVTSLSTVVDRSCILDKLAIVSNITQFRVFCYKFLNAYVGTEADITQSVKFIISACLTALQRIKMLYRDPRINKLIESSPDAVYTQMSEHIALLPDYAGSWPCVLPWMFFYVRSPQVQTRM